MRRVKVTYNGYTIDYMDVSEVDKYIQSKLRMDLNPTRILDMNIDGYRIIIYKYCTMYQEVFVIQ